MFSFQLREFQIAIAWVFALAAEMLNVVMMFGVVSRVSHVILGLTVLAWSNSIGDLVADLAVAKQGFPRMAISVKAKQNRFYF